MSIKKAAADRASKGSASADDGAKVKRSLTRTRYRPNQRWAFGFRYFKERKFFGLDSKEVDRTWLLSVIYRLGELSALSLASVLENPGESETLRMHNIDWKARNIPFKREDVDWLDEYFENPAEYPLFQISVSKALGRLVGFLDEDNIYQVVLLDPLHNAQPSNYNDYKVQLSYPLGCEITSIRHKASSVSTKSKENGCECWQGVDSAFEWSRSSPGIALVMPMKDDRILADADDMISEGHAQTYAEIFAEGVDAVLARAVGSTVTLPTASLSPSKAAPTSGGGEL